MTVEQAIVIDAHRRLGVRIAHLIKRMHFDANRDRYCIVCAWCNVDRVVRPDDVWLLYGHLQPGEGTVSCRDLVS